MDWTDVIVSLNTTALHVSLVQCEGLNFTFDKLEIIRWAYLGNKQSSRVCDIKAAFISSQICCLSEEGEENDKLKF